MNKARNLNVDAAAKKSEESASDHFLGFVCFKFRDRSEQPKKILFSPSHVIFLFQNNLTDHDLKDFEIVVDEAAKKLKRGYDFTIGWTGKFNSNSAIAVKIAETKKKYFLKYLRFESEILKKATVRVNEHEFKVKDISETGMLLLCTSSVNFFPGTRFMKTMLSDGSSSIELNLLVENIKKVEDGYSIGVSVTSENSQYLKFIRNVFDFKSEDLSVGSSQVTSLVHRGSVKVSEGISLKIAEYTNNKNDRIEIRYQKFDNILRVDSLKLQGFKKSIGGALQVAVEILFSLAYGENTDTVKMCEPQKILCATHPHITTSFSKEYLVSNHCPTVNINFGRDNEYTLSKGVTQLRSYINEFFGREKIQEASIKNKSFGHRFFVKPQWTEQHLRASVLKPYLVAANEIIGANKLNSILDEMGITFEYFKNSNNWVSIYFYDEFLNRFGKHGNKIELQQLAAKKMVTREELGLNYYILKNFFSPFSIFKISEVTAPYFNKTRTYKVFNSGLNKCSIEVGVVSPELAPKESTSCENWTEIMHCYMKLVTGDRGKVEHTYCIYKGSNSCIYDVHWKTPSSIKTYFINFLILILCVLVLSIPALDLYNSDSPALNVLPSFILLFCFFLYNAYERRKNTSLLREFERYQTQSDEKYKELQEAKKNQDLSYHESSMLERLSQEVQMNDNFNGILNQTLKTLSEKFQFHRSFVMLVDLHQKKLKTSAIFGETNNLIWHYSVDISKNRENPMVLSSVYHSGQPVWIEDVEKYLFQFNEESKKLISSLNTTSFCMAPLIGEKSILGVLVADKGRNLGRMTKRDSVLLSRVGRLLGLALDKKAQLENEVLLRKTFEKYVPYKLGEFLDSQSAGILGGSTSEVVCMFMDIRGFTKLSNAYSPNIVIDILNRTFSVAHEVITQSGGTINKFLGDGALIVWGGVTGLPGYDKILATLDILDQEIKKLSEKLEREGLPPIEIGMGLHCGSVVIGNVGSKDRLEYTVIGSTVNLASRLESLCKEFNTKQVVSKEFWEKSNAKLTTPWRRVDNVNVKGFSEPITVYIKT